MVWNDFIGSMGLNIIPLFFQGEEFNCAYTVLNIATSYLLLSNKRQIAEEFHPSFFRDSDYGS